MLLFKHGNMNKEDPDSFEPHSSAQVHSTDQLIKNLRRVIDFCLSRERCQRMKLQTSPQTAKIVIHVWKIESSFYQTETESDEKE
jgi:hypothetical protein